MSDEDYKMRMELAEEWAAESREWERRSREIAVEAHAQYMRDSEQHIAFRQAALASYAEQTAALNRIAAALEGKRP